MSAALETAAVIVQQALKLPKKLCKLVVDFVIQQLRDRTESLSLDQSNDLKTLLREYEQTQSLKARQTEFLKKYDVKVLGKGKVSFTIPEGSSRLDLLNEAQAIAPELLGQPAVYELRLEMWAKDPAFTTKVSKATSFSINGNVKGSTGKTRKEQESNGWNDVDLADLAAAHQVYLIATKKDLFGGKVVRARCGKLVFSADGLVVYGLIGGPRSNDIAASKSLPSRN